MDYRRIGTTELEVSVLGFGLWTISSEGWGKIDEADSLNLLREARHLGVTFFDTAEFFGEGYGEEILGKALSSYRHELTIGTKVIYDRYDTRLAKESRTIGKNLVSTGIRQHCEQSLRRLKTDYIDLYQISTPLSYLAIDERQDLFEILHALVKEGKVRYIGVASDPLDLEYWQISYNDAQSIQISYNILEPNMLAQVLSNQETQLVGTIIAVDSHKHDLLLGQSDQGFSLRGSDDGELKLILGTMQKMEKLTEISKRWDIGMEKLASMFCLDNSLVSTVMPDITGVDKLRRLISSTISTTLPEELSQELYDLSDSS